MAMFLGWRCWEDWLLLEVEREWEDVLLKSGCCQGFGDFYSSVGAIDAAQGKMRMDVKREKKRI